MPDLHAGHAGFFLFPLFSSLPLKRPYIGTIEGPPRLVSDIGRP